MQHHASYVHVVLLQLQNLHDCDDYDENDGHDDETHLRGHHTMFQIESSIEVRKKDKKCSRCKYLYFEYI